MKAAIYNPYLDTLGGGERYTFSLAKVLSEELHYKVFVEWKGADIQTKIEDRFGMKLGGDINFIDDVNRGDGYDLIFWVSDGSIPMLRAKKNILHFQVPFKDVDGRSLLNKMKLFRIDKIICNSFFTKKVIDQEFGVYADVLYPPVDVSKLKPRIKENTILYVGRFSNLVQNKGHKILISAFKKLVKNNQFKDWKLVLAGGIEVGSDEYLKELKKLSIGSNITFFESPSFSKLQEIYGKSKIFWSAAGYDVNQTDRPEKVEHFGMTLVEAMASGCVPIVHNSGGAIEIINDGIDGFFWNEKDGLISKTQKVVDGNFKKMSNMAIARSKDFDYSSFIKTFKKIMNF